MLMDAGIGPAPFKLSWMSDGKVYSNRTEKDGLTSINDDSHDDRIALDHIVSNTATFRLSISIGSAESRLLSC